MEKEENNSRPTGKRPKGAYAYTSIAAKMIAVILAGTLGGREIDSALALEFPAFTLALTLVAVGLAMYIVIRDLSK